VEIKLKLILRNYNWRCGIDGTGFLGDLMEKISVGGVL
jgi:hypothetical protein